jgi:tetratricopeptide (TPR) repeat protein
MTSACLWFVALLFLLLRKSFRSNAEVLDHESFISRSFAHKEYINAIRALPAEPARAVEHLLSSYQWVPTSQVTELLVYILQFYFHDEVEAEKWVSQAALVDQNHYDHLNIFQRALREYNAGNFVEALNFLGHILVNNPWNVRALFLKAVALHRIGYVQLSADTYYEILEHNPVHDESLLNLGALHQGFGEVEHAIPLYTKALQAFEVSQLINPESIAHNQIKIRVNLVLALYQLKRLEQVK